MMAPADVLSTSDGCLFALVAGCGHNRSRGPRRGTVASSRPRSRAFAAVPFAATIVLTTTLLAAGVRADPAPAEDEVARARASLAQALEALQSRQDGPSAGEFTIEDLRRTQEQIARARAALAARLRELQQEGDGPTLGEATDPRRGDLLVGSPLASTPSMIPGHRNPWRMARLLDPTPFGPAQRLERSPSVARMEPPPSEPPKIVDLPPPPVVEPPQIAALPPVAPTPRLRTELPQAIDLPPLPAPSAPVIPPPPGEPPQTAALPTELPIVAPMPPPRSGLEAVMKAKPSARDASEDDDEATPRRKAAPAKAPAGPAREAPDAPTGDRPQRPTRQAEDSPTREASKPGKPPKSARKPRKDVAATASTKRRSRASELAGPRGGAPGSPPPTVGARRTPGVIDLPESLRPLLPPAGSPL